MCLQCGGTLLQCHVNNHLLDPITGYKQKQKQKMAHMQFQFGDQTSLLLLGNQKVDLAATAAHRLPTIYLPCFSRFMSNYVLTKKNGTALTGSLKLELKKQFSEKMLLQYFKDYSEVVAFMENEYSDCIDMVQTGQIVKSKKHSIHMLQNFFFKLSTCKLRT